MGCEPVFILSWEHHRYVAVPLAAMSAWGSEEEHGTPSTTELTGDVFLSPFPHRHQGNPGPCLG